MQLLKQKSKNKLVIGAGGDDFERLVYQSYSFYNFGLTNHGCNWSRQDDNYPIICYCWTDEKRFQSYLYNSSLAIAHQKGYNNPEVEAKVIAKNREFEFLKYNIL